MLFDMFWTVLSGLFAFGLFVMVGLFVLYFKPKQIRPTVIKASDILAREGYDIPPRTRRSKGLAYV